MVAAPKVKKRGVQKAAVLPQKGASINKPGDECVKSIAALSDKQIRKESWARTRRVVYVVVWILVIIGFYLLWNRGEQCARLNRNLMNSTV